MSISSVINKISANTVKVNGNNHKQLPGQLPTIKLIKSSSKLRANDTVDWGKIGKEFDFINSNFTINSANGVKLKVSSPGSFLRLDEGSAIKGNFTSGDKLLFLEFSDGAIKIDFNTPVFGVGTQIQKAFFGAFTGVIEAFDSSGKSLGKFSVYGNSGNAGDDSATFIGVLSKTANISRITLYVPENNGYGFTINGLNLVQHGRND